MPLPPKYASLGLEPLLGEAGFFRLMFRSGLEVLHGELALPASNMIYYALTRESPQNHLHWLASDDHHILIDGGPADYFQFFEDGRSTCVRMGRELNAGEQLAVTTPGNAYKAVRLCESADYLLVGSVVTPAWSEAGMHIGAGQAFLGQYIGTSSWATPECLRSLIGPNLEA
ncbi:cupin domain-containing protein [Coraliomargarita parva]|uniref:cupin domain-containing protein n=1 Tax=Coraliomargarita parva TaxID=3014050 RepID=UPI0022B5181F|nr:cupin domain-containing protein [Coraliomargarita parva]